jgi:hypothetical protein
MAASGKPEPFRLGFLTAIDLPDKGYVGGLLVTNHFGRPLEFQCTLPVRPNATQEILYGPTLEPFLLGELIGATLIEKSGIKPHLVFTDREQILELREHIESPVLFVEERAGRARKAVVESIAPEGEAEQAAARAEALSQLGVGQSTGEKPLREIGTEVPAAGGGRTLRLGRQTVRIHSAHPGDDDRIATGATVIPADADLHEPFDRVREALQETLKSAGLK